MVIVLLITGVKICGDKPPLGTVRLIPLRESIFFAGGNRLTLRAVCPQDGASPVCATNRPLDALPLRGQAHSPRGYVQNNMTARLWGSVGCQEGHTHGQLATMGRAVTDPHDALALDPGKA